MEAHLWIWRRTTGVEPAFQNLVLRAPKSLCRLTYVRHKESLTRIFLPPNLSLSGLITRVWVVVSIRTLPVASARRGLGVGHLGFDEGMLAKLTLNFAEKDKFS